MRNKWQILNSLALRIIAMAAMVIDHVAVLIVEFHLPIGSTAYVLMRIIGRIALPLFVFLALEGVRYTRNIKKYLLRLGVMFGVMGIISAIIEYGLRVSLPPRNIFIDLLSGVTLIYFLLHPRKKNWFYLLPSIYLLTANMVSIFTNIRYPAFLLPDYGWFSLLLFLAYFLAYFLARTYLEKSTGVKIATEQELTNNNSFQFLYVTLLSVFLLWVNLIWYILDVTLPILTKMLALQSYSILAGFFLLLYNGRSGYQARWLQCFYYAFYPLSLGVTALILFLISLTN
ncbi:MAG: TraX family protein [Bacilli bacterium]